MVAKGRGAPFDLEECSPGVTSSKRSHVGNPPRNRVYPGPPGERFLGRGAGTGRLALAEIIPEMLSNTNFILKSSFSDFLHLMSLE